ncbi:cleft lip and palate transmembrane 1 [Auriculariales sp. MPI-PUGE-AT-0066]|nr:cleft lip and palate transmembrane 1 [Auriculariales sp. MPI-PUGE-AT-0066]
MAEQKQAAAAPAQGQPAAGQQQEEGGWGKFASAAQKTILFYMAMQLLTKYIGSSKNAAPEPAAPVVHDAKGNPLTQPGQPNPFELPPKTANLAWDFGTTIDMHVYVSVSPIGDVFRENQDAGLPQFIWSDISFGNWSEHRTEQFEIKLPPSVLRNGTLWAHTFLCANGSSPDPASSAFDYKRVAHSRTELTRYRPKKKFRKEKSLLSGDSEPEEEQTVVEDEIQHGTPVSHWSPNVTLNIISDSISLPWASMSGPVMQNIRLVPNKRDDTGTIAYFYPIVYSNDFWRMSTDYAEINATTTVVPLRITMQPLAHWKFQIFAQMSYGFEEQAKKGQGSEIDDLKYMLLETNPWYLGLTALVSILHMVFEMLAFKSDVQHWRKKEELVGVSVRTIVTNVFVQLIILLYLIDNNTDTSWMILFGQGMGMLIEAWKITKAVDIRIITPPAGSRFPLWIKITDKHVLSEDERKTQEYDKLAFRYVSIVTIPLLAGYTVYSLIYNTHRGWYSFVISTLTSFVYAFGFVQLVPQLIINYKLKSVAHMPIKAMVYKTLSTVVDDFFAFAIKMPWLHRLACFRDDAVFLVFIYQRWIYRIDPTRANEFGQVLVAEEKDENGETKKTK